MKRINLIPGESLQGRSKESRRHSRTVLGVLIVIGVFYLWQVTGVIRYKTIIMAKKTQIKELQTKTTQNNYAMERIRAERDKVNELRKNTVKRLALLQESRERGVVWSDVLINLSEMVPADIWLRDVNLSEKNIEVAGLSTQNGFVSDFMAQLDASRFFYSTGFKYIQKNSVEDKSIVSFEVTTRLSPELNR